MPFTNRFACASLILLLSGCPGPAAPPSDAGGDSARDATRADLGNRADAGSDAGAQADAASDCQSGCGIVEAVTGFAHTCARRENGQVLCWGRGQSSELGLGERPATQCNPSGGERESCTSIPTTVGGLNDVDQLATHGAFGVCVRSRSRDVLCWGSEVDAVGGMSGTPELTVPTAVPGTRGTLTQELSVQLHCIVLAGGVVKCRGHNEEGQLGAGNGLSLAIRPSFDFVLAPVRSERLADGGLLDAALFDGGGADAGGSDAGDIDAATGDSGTDAAMADAAGSEGMDGGAMRSDAAVADAATADGGSSEVLRTAVQIDIPIFGGGACARLSGGEIACWGNNEGGRLGDGRPRGHATCGGGHLIHDCSSVPVFVAGFDGASGHRAVDIALGTSFGCTAEDTGSVSCWGSSSTGGLGSGSTNDNIGPAAVAGLSDVVEVSAGGMHACARRRDGHVFCWGSNEHKQLGDGNATHGACASGSTVVDCALSPVEVAGLTDATSLVSGFMHTCALSQSRGLVCWGWNYYRQLGDEEQEDRATPFVVPGL